MMLPLYCGAPGWDLCLQQHCLWYQTTEALLPFCIRLGDMTNSGTTGKLGDNYDVEAVALGKGGFAAGDSDLVLSFVSGVLGMRLTWCNFQEVRRATVRVTGAKRAVKIISKSAASLQSKAK